MLVLISNMILVITAGTGKVPARNRHEQSNRQMTGILAVRDRHGPAGKHVDREPVNQQDRLGAAVGAEGEQLKCASASAFAFSSCKARCSSGVTVQCPNDLIPRFGVEAIGDLSQPLVQSAPELNAGGNRWCRFDRA
jgi:hypothetical protein